MLLKSAQVTRKSNEIYLTKSVVCWNAAWIKAFLWAFCGNQPPKSALWINRKAKKLEFWHMSRVPLTIGGGAPSHFCWLQLRQGWYSNFETDTVSRWQRPPSNSSLFLFWCWGSVAWWQSHLNIISIHWIKQWNTDRGYLIKVGVRKRSNTQTFKTT